MTEREADYWEGYRASMRDLRVALSAWTLTADVEALLDLIDERLDGVGAEADDDIPFSDEPHFRATDPHGGRGPNGPFPTATSYSAVAVDGEVQLVKAGLPEDHFTPDQAAGFAQHLLRVAAAARLPSQPTEDPA